MNPFAGASMREEIALDIVVAVAVVVDAVVVHSKTHLPFGLSHFAKKIEINFQ